MGAGSGANLLERMGRSTRAALIYLHAASEGPRKIAAGIDEMLSEGQAAVEDGAERTGDDEAAAR